MIEPKCQHSNGNPNTLMHEVPIVIQWGQSTFANALQDRPKQFSIYVGEDNDHDLFSSADMCDMEEGDNDESQIKIPMVPISPEKYHSLFQPWHGALVLKLLGKNVNFRILEQI